MQYNTSIIDAYINDISIFDEAMFAHIKNFHTPDAMRKDVVKELTQQLKQIVDGFPIFNPKLYNVLFTDKEDFIDTICICPVVGSDVLYYSKQIEHQLYIFIDLICVADLTRIISQMVYVLNNLVSLEISKACILQDYPLNNTNYDALLNEAAFVHGLAHFISWNAACDQYVFYSDKYEPQREKAFGLLAQAMQVDSKAMQHKILTHIRASDLWDQFPIVAGMFYFDDIYREFGINGLKQLYKNGPKSFIQNIFAS